MRPSELQTYDLLKDPSSGCSYVAESAVKFEGKSYLKYLHRMDEDHQNFRLSLSFKTFQERGLLASTNSTKDWGLLQVSVLGTGQVVVGRWC